MGDYEFVLYGHEAGGRIAIITLNDPKRLNCLSSGMIRDIHLALDEATQDNNVRVILLKGSRRAFCVGYNLDSDVREKSLEFDIYDSFKVTHIDLKDMLAILDVPKPTIAQIHGYAMAGGTLVASMCDLCMVAEDAIIGPPQGGPMGISGLMVSHWAHLVGDRKARECEYIIGWRMTGKEAERIGFANRAVPAEDLDEETLTLARRIAKSPLEHLQATKLAANAARDLGLRDAMHYGYLVSGYYSQMEPVTSWIGDVGKKGWRQAQKDWHERENKAVGLDEAKNARGEGK